MKLEILRVDVPQKMDFYIVEILAFEPTTTPGYQNSLTIRVGVSRDLKDMDSIKDSAMKAASEVVKRTLQSFA